MADDIEELGLEADRIDNLLAAFDIPMPADFHIAQARMILPEISAGIKKFVVETSGENPWGDA